MDITDKFLKSCNAMPPGTVIFQSGFGLSDAMSAIEIMEPKMDTGMQPHEEAVNLSALIAAGRINVNKVALKELIVVIDATLATIVSWLQGQPLDQTVFTNVCLLEPALVGDRLLAGVCAAAIRFVHCAKTCIELAGVFKEEDFSGLSERLPAAGEDAWTAPVQELKYAIELIKKRKTAYRKQSELVEAVECRLALFQSLLDIFVYLMPSPYTSPPPTNVRPNLRDGGAAADRGLDSASIVLRTIGLGVQPPTAASDDSAGVDGDFAWLPYFQPAINRDILPSNLPRQIKLMGREDALRYLMNFLKTISRMTAVLTECQLDLEGLMDFFSTYGGQKSSVLSRSIVQLLVLPHDYRICGERELSELIQNGLLETDASLCVENKIAGSLLADESLADRVSSFVTYCVHAFIGAFQMFGHNLGIQRDKLLQTCLEDFGALQIEALEIEESRTITIREKLKADGQSEEAKTMNAPAVLSEFLLQYILRLMHYHFETAFHLDLFVPYEFPYVYWYLGEIVCANMDSLLLRRRSVDIKSVSELMLTNPRKKKLMRLQTELERRRSYGATRFQLNKIEKMLCPAYITFANAMRASGRLPPAVFAGDGADEREMLRYALRFETFTSLSAAPTFLSVPYEHYRATMEVVKLAEENRVLEQNLFQKSPVHYRATTEVVKLADENRTLEQNLFQKSHVHFEAVVVYLRVLEKQLDNPLGEEMTRIMRKIAKHNAITAELLSISPKLKKTIVFEQIPGHRTMFPLIKLV